MACSAAGRTDTHMPPTRIRQNSATTGRKFPRRAAAVRRFAPSNISLVWARALGAQERTRTFTAVKPLAPEASASTNSATWAQVAGLERRLLLVSRALVKSLRCRPNAYYRGMIFSENRTQFLGSCPVQRGPFGVSRNG